MKPINSVFYSWQSDLPKECNLNAIRQSLRSAANNIENDIEESRIELDEATRNTTGSPNIPQTIFDKISKSDVFICDLTTINWNAPKTERKVPNPNVLIELGYAIAMLGWERIILLFNENFGSFPNDLPFDVDRHRATKFKIANKNDTEGKTYLTSALKVAIKAIIDAHPLKPHEKLEISPEKKKREVDISKLKMMLKTIHLPTFDRFFEGFPDMFPANILFLKGSFDAVVNSQSFFIYDLSLKDKIYSFKKDFDIALNYGHQYSSNGEGISKYCSYYFQNERSEKEYNFLNEHRLKIVKSFRELIKYIRLNYLELDIEELSVKQSLIE